MSIIVDVLTAGTNSHPTTSEAANALATDILTDGIVNAVASSSGVAPMTGGWAVNATGTPDTNVQISAGVAYVTATPSSQGSQRVRVKNTATITQAITANSSGGTRYDYIYIEIDPTNAANPAVGGDNVGSIAVSRSTSSTTDNGSGTPAYGYLIAVVTVANGFVTITNANIADKRTQTGVSQAAAAIATNGWNALSVQPTVSSGYNNGQKEFSLTFSGIDLTSTLSPGMKLKVTRGTTPNTQSMAFASASSQYATKASPSGITFTGNWTAEAWVNLQSYTGQSQVIIGRYDNASTVSGFGFQIRSDGTAHAFYANASGVTSQASAQSVPLNRWVHVAASVTVSTKTINIYINGVLVPNQTAFASAATSLVQDAVNLSVGAYNAGVANTFFNGYLANVRLWSAAQTATQIRDNMAINLTGAETNLVALFSGAGNFNDSTSNANNLTATNGAIATQAANPFNATEYAIITKVAYSNPNSTVTVFTGTDYTIPNMTLNNAQYSLEKTPFGFPSARGKWLIDSLYKIQYGTASNASYAQYTGNNALTIPLGEWDFTANLPMFNNTTTLVEFSLATSSISGAAAGSQDPSLTYRTQSPTAATVYTPMSRTIPLSLASDTTYTLWSVGATTSAGIASPNQLHNFVAVSAYV